MKKLPLILSLSFLILSLSLMFYSTVAVKAQEASLPNTYTQTAATREVLASGYPTQDQAQILELVRFVIAPNANLPVHIHPGMQIGQVEAGMLTYTVVEGESKVTKADGTELIMRCGETLELTVGDSLVEPAGMVHFGENRTDSSIILLSASLLDAEQPKTILVDPENTRC